jgi:hypothetical protein
MKILINPHMGPKWPFSGIRAGIEYKDATGTYMKGLLCIFDDGRSIDDFRLGF